MKLRSPSSNAFLFIRSSKILTPCSQHPRKEPERVRMLVSFGILSKKIVMLLSRQRIQEFVPRKVEVDDLSEQTASIPRFSWIKVFVKRRLVS